MSDAQQQAASGPGPAAGWLRLPGGKIPAWFVVLAVVVTGAITIWAMWKRGDGWPASTMPMRLAQATSPAYRAVGPGLGGAPFGVGGGGGGARVVAARAAVPTITVGSAPRHAERGACTLCHTVVDKVGAAIPMVGAYAGLPHSYNGGLCINCHTVKPSFNTNLRPMAAVRPIVRQPVVQPKEAAWQGMEVAPITPVIAAQYSIPRTIRGVAVTEVEGAAATAGVKAGDVVVGVGSVAVADMATFAAVTRNGVLPQGTVQLLRGGKFMRFELPGRAATNRPGAAAGGRPRIPAAIGGRRFGRNGGAAGAAAGAAAGGAAGGGWGAVAGQRPGGGQRWGGGQRQGGGQVQQGGGQRWGGGQAQRGGQRPGGGQRQGVGQAQGGPCPTTRF